MALIKCEHCGQPISDKAPFCPKCGFPRVKAVSEENQKQKVNVYPPENNIPPKSPKGWWAIGIIGLLILAGGIVWLVLGIRTSHEQYLAELEYQRQEQLHMEKQQQLLEEQQRLETQLRLEAEQKRIEELREDSIHQENMTLKAKFFIDNFNEEDSFDFRNGLVAELIKRGFEKTSDKLKIERNFEEEEGYIKTHEIIYTLNYKEKALSVIIKKRHFEFFSSLHITIDFPTSEDLEKFVRSIKDLGYTKSGNYYELDPLQPGLVFLKEGKTIKIFDIVA